ncbi:MAG: folate-binding protein, partial [Gammaproteobacteria bacterium]|nr:folate-binding protein [Gammaproteobacteria bacterium]
MNPPTLPSVPLPALHGATPLPQLGVIRVQGEDAAKFLHGQLTQDFALLGLSEARLAAFCSAKGRMLASFVGFKLAHDDVLLVCSRDLLPATLKRLSMFVLRAKARLSDASAEFQVWGLSGSAAPAGAKTWSKSGEPGAAQTIALYPSQGLPRALWVAPAGHPPPAGDALPEAHWAWLD